MAACYLRGRQAATSFRGTKSSMRIVRTGVPQGSKLSPSLFNYYIADMPRPTPPVKRVCYADDITVWATGPKIPQMESMITNYLRDVLISAPKSTVTLFTPLSKINRSQLPPATARWLSCYLRGRQAKTCFRGVKSTSRKVNTGIPQGSKLSPSLFSFDIADMPIPTEPVKRVCYADDLTVWASGVNIQDLEVSINNYLEEITAYLKDNSLLISAPKSSVTLLTPDTHEVKIHPRILIENSYLPLVKCPRILGVYLDPSLSFNKHSQYVADRVSGRNNKHHP